MIANRLFFNLYGFKNVIFFGLVKYYGFGIDKRLIMHDNTHY